jgi:hypothetical protein
MNKPNFFIIGAPKCGTTSLANWLSQHPNVYISHIKEPHYFNDDDTFRFVESEQNYIKLFTQSSVDHIAIGESSTWYLFSKTAVKNIENFTGKTAKYIVCLRNPVELVQSLHSQMLISGNETEKDFIQAWHLQSNRRNGKNIPFTSNAISHLQYKDACSLGTQVHRLLKTVPPERIHFVVLDDIAKNPEKTYNDVLYFLKLKMEGLNIRFQVKNEAKIPKSYFVNRIISYSAFLRRFLGLQRGMGLLTLIRRLNQMPKKIKPIDFRTKKMLFKEFEEEINLIERLTQRDLSTWKIND